MAGKKFLTIENLSRSQIRTIFLNIQVDRDSGCWNFLGRLDAAGYGRMNCDGRNVLAHRAMFAWLVQPIERGRGRHVLVLDHLCRNRRCCNPAHLDLVTDRVNFERSNSAASINLRKTHCIRGHQLPAPTVIATTGKRMRQCRVCKRAYDNARRIDLDARSARVEMCPNGHKRIGSGACVVCSKAAKTRYYFANRESVIAKARVHKIVNRDAINAARRERRAKKRHALQVGIGPSAQRPELFNEP